MQAAGREPTSGTSSTEDPSCPQGACLGSWQACPHLVRPALGSSCNGSPSRSPHGHPLVPTEQPDAPPRDLSADPSGSREGVRGVGWGPPGPTSALSRPRPQPGCRSGCYGGNRALSVLKPPPKRVTTAPQAPERMKAKRGHSYSQKCGVNCKCAERKF